MERKFWPQNEADYKELANLVVGNMLSFFEEPTMTIDDLKKRAGPVEVYEASALIADGIRVTQSQDVQAQRTVMDVFRLVGRKLQTPISIAAREIGSRSLERPIKYLERGN